MSPPNNPPVVTIGASRLGINDIVAPMEGMVLPAEDHVRIVSGIDRAGGDEGAEQPRRHVG